MSSKNAEEIKEETLAHIGLSKANRDFYQKLYGNGNALNQPDKTKKEDIL
jgi:hypothetical protein